MQVKEWWNQLKKQLKRKLRLKRGWLHLAVVLLAMGVFASWLWFSRSAVQAPLSWDLGEWQQDRAVFSRQVTAFKQPEEEVRKIISGMEGKREAFSKKAYVCGEELERIGLLDSNGIMNYYRNHPSITVSLGETNTVYFTESIDDLSPACKEKAYFGLDAKGNLSLFEGVPNSGTENVMRTFFQLNIEHLESSLPRETVRQLYHGIRIHDLEDYNSVLSTLSDYAVEETENAMQRAPSP
ncbi:BofC C-terminal domain-containing protein [Paenibacillus validus]|uniref:BofC C-terminal domain-containing protein n=1 Tax=Paenibacillus TaxID=44249 RepID=UPI000FD7647A|nr:MULTISPECIES: BofC C-terminal domain-containing protein [Paenibacillus]MED4602936.1 BofC C-terminal domain-containing protein [Paenibacillus validus]MED4608797.1 BofC C-terminal domain-containing protein [Paenibacillus validus]